MRPAPARPSALPRLVAPAALVVLSTTAHAGSNLTDNVRVLSGANGAAVKPAGQRSFKALPEGGRVPAGAELRCEHRCAVQIDAQNVLALGPGTTVTVGGYFYVPLVANAPSLTPAHRVELHEGSLEADSPSARAIPIVVTTGPEEHVALRDARAEIVQTGERTVAGALRGQVRIGGSHSWITVEVGQSGSVRRKGRPSGPRALPPAPRWLSPSDACPGAVALGPAGAPAEVGGCWDAAPGADAFEVDVAADPTFEHEISSERVTGRRAFTTLAGAGRYFARVRALDEEGLRGLDSATLKLAVVGYSLGLGATARPEKRTFVVPEGREVTLGDADDLELATDGGGFMRAPKLLVMDDRPAHSLRFRLSADPGSLSQTYTTRRRALVAKVRLSPVRVFWPVDPVNVQVQIEDPSGEIDPSRFEPRLRVLLGLNELPVGWSHRGSTWNAKVDPRPTGGPTVLRVIAEDEFGTQIGRSFLEIEEKAAAGSGADGRRFANN